MFLLIRHASWDVRSVPEERFRGHGIDMVPLTLEGIREAASLADRLANEEAVEVIISSPMTRALQTAMILGDRLQKRVAVELDLHEWVPDLQQQWIGGEVPTKAYEELTALGGEWPAGERRDWEPYSAIRQRVGDVLRRYVTRETVAVVCHSVVIEALTGIAHTAPCGVVPYRTS